MQPIFFQRKSKCRTIIFNTKTTVRALLRCSNLLKNPTSSHVAFEDDIWFWLACPNPTDSPPGLVSVSSAHTPRKECALIRIIAWLFYVIDAYKKIRLLLFWPIQNKDGKRIIFENLRPNAYRISC